MINDWISTEEQTHTHTHNGRERWMNLWEGKVTFPCLLHFAVIIWHLPITHTVHCAFFLWHGKRRAQQLDKSWPLWSSLTTKNIFIAYFRGSLFLLWFVGERVNKKCRRLLMECLLHCNFLSNWSTTLLLQPIISAPQRVRASTFTYSDPGCFY